MLKGLVLGAALAISAAPAWAMTQADGAKLLASTLHLPTNSDRTHLYGTFPAIWPGGYEGTEDIAYPDREATLETLVVAIVRWAGWDTVAYDKSLVPAIKPYVSPDGFPYYKFSPSPRAIPYVAAALSAGLIQREDLPNLRKAVTEARLVELGKKALEIEGSTDVKINASPTLNLPHLSYPTGEARLALLQPGFRDYDKLESLPGRVFDLAGPEIRLFNQGSQLATGKQTYFPLGPLESLFAAGLNVSADDLSHQSQAIYGLVDNHSSTVNAVGLWGAGRSWEHDSRVWGGFLVAESANAPEKDAQLVGLEVDVINNAAPGVAPNTSKSGIQIVGIGSQAVTDAINVIGSGQARWANGIIFSPDAIRKDGAFIGVAPGAPVARGIDLANVHFTDSAIALGKWSAITFRNTEGATSAILTDDSNRLLIRTGKAGLRVINDQSKLVAEITPDGDIITPNGKVSDLFAEVKKLETEVNSLKARAK